MILLEKLHYLGLLLVHLELKVLVHQKAIPQHHLVRVTGDQYRRGLLLLFKEIW